MPCTRNLFLAAPIRFNGWSPKVSKGRSESPLVASAEAKPSAKQKKESKVPSLALYKKPISCGSHPLQRVVAEGFQRATGKPFGRLRRGETLCETEKESKAFSLASHQEICFLWEVSPACGRTRYFPRAGKYPKGAGGGQRVHVSWPPPDPPLLSNSVPLASQGRAQLGSHPSLGGPLSPTAQLIPPPAFGRRVILGVLARGRHDSVPWRRNVPWHWGRGHVVAK